MALKIHEIQRALEVYVDRKAASLGYFVDKDVINTEPTFLNAKNALLSVNGFLIQTFGVGQGLHREQIRNGSIIIDFIGENDSNIAWGNSLIFEENVGGSFDKKQIPDTLVDLEFQITTIAENTNVDRIQYNIIKTAFGLNKVNFLNGIQAGRMPTADYFKLMYNTMFDVSTPNYFERKYSFTALKVEVQEPVVIQGDIAKITSIELGLSDDGDLDNLGNCDLFDDE